MEYFFCWNSVAVGYNETAIRNVFQLLYTMVRYKKVDDQEDIEEFRRAERYYNITIEMMMRAIIQPCDKMIRMCLWLNQKIPCDQLFNVSKTSQGFCCSFNYIGTPR